MSASLSRLQNFYGDMGASLLLHAMITREFAGHIALLTSFGADAGLLLSMVAEIKPDLPVLFLDTGKHFPETLDYARQIPRHLGLKDVRWLTPDKALAGRSDADGALWSRQPNRCCWLRKVEPLNRAIEAMGFLAIITGRRRYQAETRAELQTVELDENGVFRINPLAGWSREESREATLARALPPHSLVAKGYPSIGCAPCTLPVAAGKDERSGRWAHARAALGEEKTECGIHVPAQATTWSV